MTIPARLKSHLDEAYVSYLRISHVPTYSTQYAASVMHALERKSPRLWFCVAARVIC